MVKSIKYNAMLVLLIVVIGIFLGATSVLSSGTSGNINPNPSPGTEQSGGEDSGNQMPTGKFTPPSTTASPHTRLAFAFKVLQEGDGYYAEITQTVIAMGLKQNIFSQAYRTGKNDMVEEWKFSDAALAKTEFVSRYSDGSNIKINKISDKSKFSGPSKTYEEGYADKKETISYNEYFSKFGNFNDFPLLVNNKTITITRDDKKIDPKNYTIIVSYNTSAVEQKYLNTFEENGTKNVRFSEINITFKINKITGFFSSIEKSEVFDTNYAGIDIKNSTGTMRMDFKKMNISMQSEINAKVAKNFK